MDINSRLSKLSQYYPLVFTIIFVSIILQYSFNTLEAVFYDLRVAYDVGVRPSEDIIIIYMDEESEQFLGEIYPYTYATHNRLIENLIEAKPKVIGYLVNFEEPGSIVEERDQRIFKNKIKSFINSGGSFRFGTEMDVWGGEVLPPENLQDLGFSLSILNYDNVAFARDDITRRAILNISGEDSFHLWMANEYRRLKGLEPVDATSFTGAYYVTEADATFSLYRYSDNPIPTESKRISIPFHRVVVGNFPEELFKDKIVLIGPRYLSNSSDFALTPFNKENFKAAKINIHSIIIDALMNQKTIYQIPRWFTNTLALIIAVLLSITISKIQPARGLLITVEILIATAIIAYLIFVVSGLWLYISHIILSVFVVYYIWVPYRAIEEYQRRYAIQEETKLLKQVDHLKQNFISLMSHDLKTPVAKISGVVDLLRRQYPNNEDQERLLDNISHATKELNSFITSILDLTKIESEKFKLNIISKDVNKVLEEVLEKLRYEAKDKEVTFEVSLAPLYPIKMDLELLRRVFSNLIENAIKYSGKGSVVSVETWDDEKWVFIKIKDNGIGIGEEEQKHIFKKFYRVKNDASHSIKGTGLGLYLVKYFVELHQGTIICESSPGAGTAFTIQLVNS